MYANTEIDYPAPAYLLDEDNHPSDQFAYTEDDQKYARTEDGKLYARMELAIGSDVGTWINFHLYVQLSEADWNALREGTAKFVTGRIENRTFIDIGEYCPFYPEKDKSKTHVGWACISLSGGDGLSPIFEALSERELEAA